MCVLQLEKFAQKAQMICLFSFIELVPVISSLNQVNSSRNANKDNDSLGNTNEDAVTPPTYICWLNTISDASFVY